MFDIGNKKYFDLTPEEHEALINEVAERAFRDQDKLLEKYEKKFGKSRVDKSKKIKKS